MEVFFVFACAWLGLLALVAVASAVIANFVSLSFRPVGEFPSFRIFAFTFVFVACLLVYFFHSRVFAPVWGSL